MSWGIFLRTVVPNGIPVMVRELDLLTDLTAVFRRQQMNIQCLLLNSEADLFTASQEEGSVGNPSVDLLLRLL